MHAGRRDRLRESIPEDAEGILVSDFADLRYLTGFTGSNGAIFVCASGPDGDIFSTDSRYTEQASLECPDLGVLVARQCLIAVAEQCVAQGFSEVLVDDRLPSGQVGEIAGAGLRSRPVRALVADLRQVKDSAEIEALAEACAITSGAIDALATEIRVGDTELRIARRLEQLFGDFGAEDRAFPTIVAAGANSAIPHHAPRHHPLCPGDLLVIDSGARVRGYHADMTRTFIVGEPSPWQIELHDLVASAARASRALARAGVSIADLDSAGRGMIEEAGMGDFFGHGLGHGIGLEIHEAPMISHRAEGRLAAETTITVEPGVYLPGRGGVRIEDSLLVTVDGHRSLTSSPRDLRAVG